MGFNLFEVFSLLTPMLLHMGISALVSAAAVFGVWAEAATACTAVSAALTIPAAMWMMRRDARRYGTTAGAGQNAPRSTEKTNTDSSRSARRIACRALLCFLCGGLLNILWSSVLNELHITETFSNRTQEALLAADIALQLVGLGILVPVAEELIFRALTYTRLKRFFSVPISIFLSAVLFAVYHGNPVQMIFAFPMAVALAIVFERGKLFLYPVLFHMGANLTAVFLNFFI